MGREIPPIRLTEDEIIMRNRDSEIDKLLNDQKERKSLFEKILNYFK